MKIWKNKFVDYFGICYQGKDRIDVRRDNIEYPVESLDGVLIEHRDYLLRLEDKEEKRLVSIESKTMQLIAQSGIVFSLLSIFIPILVDKLTDTPIFYRVIIFILLFISISFYILSILNAAKNFLVNRYQYAAPTPDTILDFLTKSKEAFLSEQIKDLIFTIKVGKHQNNRKASNLIHSSRCFQMANIFSAVLVIVFVLVSFNNESKITPTIIKNPLKIEGLDSLIKVIKNQEVGNRTNSKTDSLAVIPNKK